MYKRILVPLDRSTFSTRALKYAIDLAPRYGAKLILLTVIEPAKVMPLVVDPTGLSSPILASTAIEQAQILEAQERERSRRYLARKVNQLKKRGIDAEYVLAYGQPADTIMKIAREKKADLIVMATHGRTGLKRAIMGSVAEKVIRESSQPVLVIRPRPDRKKTKK